MKLTLILSAFVLLLAGCVNDEGKVKEGPLTSVVTGDSKNAGDYIERVRETNKQQRENNADWITGNPADKRL